MKLANEIVWRAVEASQRVRDQHTASVRDVAQRFANHIGNPWKWRVEVMREIASKDGEILEEEEAPA